MIKCIFAIISGIYKLLIFSFLDRICRTPSMEECNRKLRALFCAIIIPSGSVEILMILLLTITGEREESSDSNSAQFSKILFIKIIY